MNFHDFFRLDTIYGQEKDNATWALSKMNMILHGNEIADIRKGDTITSPQLLNGAQLRTFDFARRQSAVLGQVVEQRPRERLRSLRVWRPPAKNGDYAFLLHILKSLKSTGKAAVILPHGVLFRGNAEADIRKELIKRGYIKGIIGLPPNLFYGTGIPACIVVLDKENAQARTGIFMIDASKGFMKDGPKNRLRAKTSTRSSTSSTSRPRSSATPAWCRLAEIADPKNDFNLNIPRYIDSVRPRGHPRPPRPPARRYPRRDLDALADYWEAFPQTAWPRSSSRTALATATRRSTPVRFSRPSSTRRSSRSSLPLSRDLANEWFTPTARLWRHRRLHATNRPDRHHR